MAITTQEIKGVFDKVSFTAVIIVYLFICGGLYIVGYWGSFNLDVTPFIGITDVPKSFFLPFDSSDSIVNRQTPKVMFVNCGDYFGTRSLKDNFRLDFISAGQGKAVGDKPWHWSNQIRNLIIGDVICVYRKRVGYVGLAQVISRPMPITLATLGGKRVTPHMFSANTNMFNESEDPRYEECLVEIKWLTNVHLSEREGSGACYGMFANMNAVCSLDNQKQTRICLQGSFKQKFSDLIPNYVD